MSSEEVGQLTAITGCSEAVARDLLAKYDRNIERALNAFYEAQDQSSSQVATPATSAWPDSFPDPHVEWSKPAGPPPSSSIATSAAAGPSAERPQQSVTIQRPSIEPPAYDFGLAANDSNGPIDLTGDSIHDEDIRKAMAASLEDLQGAGSGYSAQASAASQATIGPMPESQQQHQTAAGRRESATGSTRRKRRAVSCHFLAASDAAPQTSDETEAISSVAAPGSPNPLAAAGKYGLRDRGKIARPTQGLAAPASLRLSATERSSAPGGRHQGSRTYGRRRANRRLKGELFCEEVDYDMTLSEDEQLRQALEASVQSHNGGGLGQETSGSRTPLLPPHLELGEKSQRKDGTPIALVPPFATIEVVAALLQAMFASTPARHAFLSFALPDERATDLVNYWKGVSPSSSSSSSSDADAPLYASIDPRYRPAVDLCRRLQTLFAFMNESERSACVVTDVSTLTPNRIHLMGANAVPPSTIATTFYEFVVSSYEDAVKATAALFTASADQLPPGINAAELQEQMAREQTSVFQSYGAIAHASPPSPSDGHDADGIPHPASVPVPRCFLRLIHDAVNSDIFSCLRAALATDGEGALITDAAGVLAMAVDHQPASGDESLPPFTVEETLYLDPFLWNKRRGLRLDSELYAPELQVTHTAIQELEARKQKLEGAGDKESATLLKTAVDYFERLTLADKDTMRGQMQSEAALRLRQILARLEQDRRDTDALIGSLRAQVDSKGVESQRLAREEAARPEWRKVAYELQAVLVHESHRIMSYVKQRDSKWWRTCGGVASEVSVEEATGDKLRDRNSGDVFWVCYQRRRLDQTPGEPCPEATKSAVQEDNLTLQSELLSLARSDAATPIATDMGAGGDEGDGNDNGNDAQASTKAIPTSPAPDTEGTARAVEDTEA